MTTTTEPDIANCLQGIDCLYVPVANVYESIQWYEKNLGVKPSHHNPVTPEMTLAILVYPAKGPAIFLLQSADRRPWNFNNLGGKPHECVCLSVNNIDVLYRHMKANGVRIEGDGVVDRGGCGSNFQFYDPDGNKFDVNQPR